MWIESVKLKNIRGYKEAEVNLSKCINIIIGDNNSGKSTIIRTIDRLQGSNWSANGLLRNGEELCRGEIIFRDLDKKNKKGSSPLKVVFLADKERINFYQTSILSSTFILDKLKRLPSEKNEFQFPPSFKTFDPFEDSEPDNVLYASYSRTAWVDSQISEDNTHRIRQDLGNLTSRLHKLENGNHPNHKEFKKACRKILGFEPGPIPIGKGGGNQFSIGIYTDNTNSIVINYMGQGVSQVLGLLTILFTQKNKIILLEEIENDLHPKVLKQLLDLIQEKSKENQFIISTHSNIVLKSLGSVSDSKIFKTSWKMVTSNYQNLPLSDIKEVPSDPWSRMEVLKEMGYDVTDFGLYAGYLLFEESTAELFFKEFLIPEFIPKLYGKIGTYASNGVDEVSSKFKTFLGLFVFIHLSQVYEKKAWAIVDGDEAGLKVIKDLRKTYVDWSPGNFIALKEPDFEHYYPNCFKDQVLKVLQMPKGMHKQKAKVKLRTEVLDWALQNKEEAKDEFQKSAGEIIEILKRIAKELS
jgi:AAA15 family ATPase/GTPase